MDLNTQETSEQTIFANKVNSIRAICKNADSKEMVMHVGELDQNQVNNISTIVENQMENMGIGRGVVKRIFNIAIETLQNICFHAEKDNSTNQMTYFIIGKHQNDFVTYSGNVLPKTAAEGLMKRLERVRSLNDADLKKEYLEVLSNGELSKKGGAGLGFITIALKSNNNIEFEFQPLNNEYSLFSMAAKVTA